MMAVCSVGIELNKPDSVAGAASEKFMAWPRWNEVQEDTTCEKASRSLFWRAVEQV
jgi:hypothetical protein